MYIEIKQSKNKISEYMEKLKRHFGNGDFLEIAYILSKIDYGVFVTLEIEGSSGQIHKKHITKDIFKLSGKIDSHFVCYENSSLEYSVMTLEEILKNRIGFFYDQAVSVKAYLTKEKTKRKIMVRNEENSRGKVNNRLSRSENSGVYFITDGNFVKIGISHYIPKRMIALQTANPNKLKIICRIPCRRDEARILETELHSSFMGSLHRGEWYKLTAEIMAFINKCNRGEY